MRKRVKLHFQDGSTIYLQGFDNTGQPSTGVRDTAHNYPDWVAPTAARNAKTAYNANNPKNQVKHASYEDVQ